MPVRNARSFGTSASAAVTSVTLSTDNLKEQLPAGTEIGTLAAEGLNPPNFYTYTLVDSANYPDNNAFTIAGDKLYSAEVFDTRVKDTYTIKVNAFLASEPRDESIDEVLTISWAARSASTAAAWSSARRRQPIRSMKRSGSGKSRTHSSVLAAPAL